MAKKLISEELDALIQQYLTDGVLTEKERQVILRKAESMCLNRDEIDLYLDAEVQKIDQATDAAVRKQKGKSCPFCGSPVPQLADKCPECGQIITAEASKELQEIIEKLEEALISFKTGKDVKRSKATVEKYVRKAELYYESNPKVQKLLAQINKEVSKEAKSIKMANIIASIKKYGLLVLVMLLIAGWIVRCEMNSPEQVTANVIELINEDKLSEAKDVVMGIEFGGGLNQIQDYDAMFLAVIKEYINRGDFDTAEIVALAYRSKLDFSWDWEKSPTYKYLKSLYIKEGRDFSSLRYDEEP